MAVVAQFRAEMSQGLSFLPGAPGRDEFALLLAAGSSNLNDQAPDEIRELLQRPMDWALLISLGRRHGLIPALYQSLAGPENRVPSGAWQELQSVHAENARQALYLTQLLCKVLAHLASNGVAAIPYKGPVLAELLFQNVALRQFSDIDILVRPQEVSRARIALRDLGFSGDLQLSPRQEQAYLATGYEYAFDGMGKQSLIELQWRILPRFYAVDFDMEGLFSRTRKISLAGAAMRTLSPDDLFLVLCAHSAKHLWARVAWLRDIARLAQSEEIDWLWVRKQARQLGIERIVRVTMALARDLLGAAIPIALGEIASQGTEAQLALELRRHILSGDFDDTESPAYFRQMMRLRERKADRAKFLARLAFTPSAGEWSAVPLPDALFPVYRLLRPFRLLGKLRGWRPFG